MTVYVVTNSRSVRASFAAIDRSRTYTVEYAAIKDLGETLRRAAVVPESFVYVDVSGMDHLAVKRRLRRLRTERPYRYGVIDHHGRISDVAELFHAAAADYLGKSLIADGVSTARLRRVVEYEPTMPADQSASHVPEHEVHRFIPSGSDWADVEDGKVYTFLMVYAGLDQAGDLHRKSSEGFLASLRRRFSAMLEQAFAEHAARVWMWKEDEGLLLMPFDGQTINAVVPALRLVLNRVVINAEEFAQFGELSWRLALHLGNTTYRSSGRTGAIVSESVNFLFHLGSRFVEPGGLAVTGACHPLVPEGVRPLFNHRGSFESVHVYTLRERL